MATEPAPIEQRIEFLEAALDYFRELLAATEVRGFDTARRRTKIIAAINQTRDELICARHEAEFDA